MSSNQDLAQVFENIADLLQIKGEVIHRVMAYRRAGEVIRDLPRDLAAIQAEGGLTAIDGIGKTLAEKIEEYLSTGRLSFYDRLTAEMPLSLLDVLRVNGVGPKKAKLFWEKLNITTLTELENAARQAKLRDLEGMGAKSEAKILEAIEALARQGGRIPIGQALPIAQGLLGALLALPQALKGDWAGSLRRFRPTIGDIDLLIASEDPGPIMEFVAARPQVERILGQGPTKTSVEWAEQGVRLQVDVRVLPPREYGTGLAYFTGSQAHNIQMRQLALEQGLSLNEHCYTRLSTGEQIFCETEEAVYATLGLAYVPPELREDRGEMAAAQAGRLPALITAGDVRGDLHMHTTWSDGRLSILEMARIAMGRGLSYIVITDHSHGLGVANGLSVERLMAQKAEIAAANAELGGQILILHGTEMEIRADGSLDFTNEVLAQLDFVIASLHTHLSQPRAEITARLLKAIHNPQVDLIAHPRGQLIGKREPADLDMEAVISAARQADIALEINANPARLDLEAPLAQLAAERGVKIALNTDSHSGADFAVLPYGIGTARRAWLSPEQVINTWPQERFLAWVRARGA
jgi:DNA polymerase (family 10)